MGGGLTDVGGALGVLQLNDGRVVSTFGTQSGAGIAISSDSITGLCRDSMLTVTLNTVAVPEDTVYTVTRSATHIFVHDTTNVFSPLPTYYIDSCLTNTSTAVEEFALPTSYFELYPNPASSAVTISVSEKMIGTMLTFTDITGKKIMAVQLETVNRQLSTENFASGIYFVTLENEKGRTTKKLVIEK